MNVMYVTQTELLLIKYWQLMEIVKYLKSIKLNKFYTPWAIKNGANLFLSVTSWKNQRILMQFSLLELTMNDTCDSMHFHHLT